MTIHRGDLKDIVFPIVEIDTFEAKFDDKATVLTFFTKIENAAKDLSNFIEFGAVDVLDTEVSLIPDEYGRYMVFVELATRDMEVVAEMTFDILKSLENLTTIKNWKWTVGKDNTSTIRL